MIRIAIDHAANRRLKATGIALIKLSRFELDNLADAPEKGDVLEVRYGVEVHTVDVRHTKMRPYWLELEVRVAAAASAAPGNADASEVTP